MSKKENYNVVGAIALQLLTYPFSGGFIYAKQYTLALIYGIIMWTSFFLMGMAVGSEDSLFTIGILGITITFFASIIHLMILSKKDYEVKTFWYRSKKDKLLGGILASLAHKLGWNPWVLRIGIIFLSFMGDGGIGGLFVMFYLILWLVLPLGKPLSQPPVPNFTVKLPLNRDVEIEEETGFKPKEEILIDCPYCNFEQTFYYSKIKHNPSDRKGWFSVKCQNCKNDIDIDTNENSENEVDKLRKEIDYEIYLEELNKFSKSQDTFIVKNYVLFCFEEFGDECKLKYLSKFFKEELDKNLPESILKSQLNNIKKNMKKKKKRYSMAQIDSMGGIEFEELVKELFQNLNYSNVVVTSKSRDGGTDVIAHKNNKKYIIQAKRYQAAKTLGITAIQEIISGKVEHKADKLMVVTTAGKFSVDAKRKAKDNSVELVDRIKLKKMLMEAKLI